MSSLGSVLGSDFSGSELHGCETLVPHLNDSAEEYYITGQLFRPGFPLSPEEATPSPRGNLRIRTLLRLPNGPGPVILEVK